MKRPRPGDRAQPLGYATAFAALIVAGLLWIFLQEPLARVTSRRANATANVSSDVRREALMKNNALLDLMIENFLVIAMAVVFFGMIAFTVFLRRSGP